MLLFYAHYADKDELQKGIQQQVFGEKMSAMIDGAQITNGNRVKVKRAENY